MQKAILTIAFDDGYLDTYRYAISYLDKVGIKCTFAVPVKLIGKTCEKRLVLKWGHLNRMARNRHEIASHTLHHIKLKTQKSDQRESRAEARDKVKTISQKSKVEIVKSKYILEEKLAKKISSFVYPYLDKPPGQNISGMVKRNYLSSRISKNFSVFNKFPVQNPYNLQGFCVMTKHTLPYLAQQIDKAIKTKSWLIEVFHLVGKKNTESAHRSKPYRFFMHIDDFKKHIDAVLSENIEILTQKEVVRRYVN